MAKSVGYREDHDTIGAVKVPAEALWSAQTQRSIDNFPFGPLERQADEIISALAMLKQACAMTNRDSGKLSGELADAIIKSASEIIEDRDFTSFPLVIFQTGSGTQSNMNMNEVLSNKANLKLGGELGSKKPVHPNDHVNMGQSSNDVFPSAMHVAVTLSVKNLLLPSLNRFMDALSEKQKSFDQIIKMGRTHLMDAVPMTLGQEFSSYVASLSICKTLIEAALPCCATLALGGTAVGTGLNSYVGFDETVAKNVSFLSNTEFKTAANKFAALSSITPIVGMSGSITTLATSLHKFANDVRLLASGPRSGLGELVLPSNEPGSSIMPGKVNPTQCESMAMVCAQVVGNNSTIIMCNTYGHLQLNVHLPVVANALLRSIRLLAISMDSFRERCLAGMEANQAQINLHVQNSLMLVTALAPHIGYDNAAKIAKNAHNKGTNLKESAAELELLSPEDFDKYVVPAKMIGPSN